MSVSRGYIISFWFSPSGDYYLYRSATEQKQNYTKFLIEVQLYYNNRFNIPFKLRLN